MRPPTVSLLSPSIEDHVSAITQQWQASEGEVIGWGGAAAASGSDGRIHATCLADIAYFEVLLVNDAAGAELSVGFGDAAYTPESNAMSGCVGCGIDPNGRPFYTCHGEIVHVDNRRLSQESPPVVALIGSTPGSVVLLNVGQHPWCYSPAAAGKEHLGDLVAAVSRWVACTGFSPLVDCVLVPEGRLSSDLIVDDSPLKDLSWDRVFCDGPEGNAAKLHRDVTLRTYRTTEYHVLHTGGFLRLCTMRGRMYWLAQNQTGHITPDWKLHFSVELQDIPQAWDLLAALFLERGCEVGMKATYAHLRDESYWSSAQRGREITLYIYTHDKAFEEAQEDDCCLWLGTEYERPWSYYASLVRAAEARLEAAGIRSRGCADGDLALGAYTSLRNEAFVPHKTVREEHKIENVVATEGQAAGALVVPTEECASAAVGRRIVERVELVYPPNKDGWNAAGHCCPLPIFELRCAAGGLGVREPFARRGEPQWLE